MSPLLSTKTDFFGLDIGTTSIRLVQLKAGNPKTLVKYAYVPVDSNLTISDSKADQQKLGQIILQLIKQSNLSTKFAAVSIPSNRVFTTVAEVDKMSPSELAKSVPYQADSLIPTAMSDSKIDWALVGDSPTDTSKLEIVLSSVPKKFVEGRLDMLEGIGLNIVAFEPDSLALVRSLTSPSIVETQLILDIGFRSTNMIVVTSDKPHLVRNIPSGVDAILKSAMQNLNIDIDQATQFVYKFGLNKDKLEGTVYEAISSTIEIIMSEIEKSLKFFNSRYVNQHITRIVLAGGATTIPELPSYIANKFNLSVEIANAWKNVAYSQDRADELAKISSQFGVAIGLAEREI